jgi:hypothetical protein
MNSPTGTELGAATTEQSSRCLNKASQILMAGRIGVRSRIELVVAVVFGANPDFRACGTGESCAHWHLLSVAPSRCESRQAAALPSTHGTAATERE